MIQLQHCRNSKQKQATKERTAKIASILDGPEKICGTPLSAAAGIDEIYPLNGHRLIRKREPM